MRLLDPRGQLTLERVTLAPRLAPDALAAGTVLFYDNLKMDVGHYGALFPRIRHGLTNRGIARFIDHRETIRGKSPGGIAALAQKLADMKPAAAVIALADMGVSPAMVALTIALEKAGIPTACLTAQPGSALAVAHAHYRAGALCLIDLDVFPASEAGDVERQADACVERIVTALTQGASHADSYPIDREAAQDDGHLPVRHERSGSDAEVYDTFESLHIGDGLPIVAPTPERFERMREHCPFDVDDVIASGIGPSGTPIRVRDALVAAVMAGCRPHYVPIVLTALRALARPEYGLIQAVTTTFSGGHFVLASGPIAQQIGMHGGAGCLGPGFRANATIGRAVNLALLNVCRPVPGHADLACLSSPAEFTYCFAEDPRLSPWPTLNAERYDADTTCVMVLKAEAPHNVLDIGSTTGAALLETFIDCCTTLGSNNASNAGPLVLVLNPDHARILARDGYDKRRIRREVHAGARIPLERIRSRGIVSVAAQDHSQGFQYVTRSPDDVQVVVAGGQGGHSAVLLPWALYSDAVFEVVRSSEGTPARSIAHSVA
ncbi:MAG TPA: hypothetical protein VHP37_25845 [Burkholderiales bacterium]|nr:hypothetical protein [Burkholderiales bacterium]